MKKNQFTLLILICFFGFSFTKAQPNNMATASTNHFNTNLNPKGKPVGALDIKPHAVTLKFSSFFCYNEPFGRAVASFFNEKDGSTWLVVRDDWGNIIRSTELFDTGISGSGTNQTFHITAAKSIPGGNDVVFTGKVFDSNTNSFRLIAGTLDLCTQTGAVTYEVAEFNHSEGVEIIESLTKPNEFTIVGVYNANNLNSGNELVVATYDFTSNSILQIRHHRISFNTNDVTANLTNQDNVIISGVSEYRANMISNQCMQQDVTDRSIVLIDYDVNTMSIANMQSYSTYRFIDRGTTFNFDFERANFMIEGFEDVNGTVQYFGTTAMWDRIDGRDLNKDVTAALLTFDDALATTGSKQIDLMNHPDDGLRNANIAYVGTSTGIDLLGISLHTSNYDGSFSDKVAIVTVPVDAANPFVTIKGKRTAQKNGAVLGINNVKYGNIATRRGFSDGLLTSIATRDRRMVNANENYIHLNYNSLDNTAINCEEIVHIAYWDICLQEVTSDNSDPNGTDYGVFTSTYAKDPVVGDNVFCSGSPIAFRKKQLISNSLEEINAFTMSPNPANNQLNLTFDNIDFKESVNVKILDLTGRVLLSDTYYNPKVQLNVSELPLGTYLLRVEQGDEIINRKWIKQ